MKRALVAGATGYLGNFVVRELKSRGYFVRALARTPGKIDDLKEELDEIHIGEVTQPETLEGICNDIDVVFSSIGITRQKDGLTFRDVDLAVACADAMEADETEIDVGGPQTLTWSEIAQLAFEIQDRPAKITHLPKWLMWAVVRLVRLFNRHQGDLLAFFTTMTTTDVVAPSTGTHTLETHYRFLGGGI